MAKQTRKAAAKKATAEAQPARKVIRRRNEKNEIVEIEVDVVPVEKATVRRHVETADTLLERRKRATDHLALITGKNVGDNAVKAALGKAITAIDKRMKSLEER